MSLKKLGVALLAVFVLGAIAANTAFAKEEYRSEKEASAWYVSGTKLGESTKKLTTKAIGTQSLKTKVAGENLKINATTVNCLSCTIMNDSTLGTADGVLEFTGLSVSEPAGCSTTSSITTKSLKAVVNMNKANTVATLKFTPAAGASTAFATVELIGTSCPIAGTYKVTGTQFAQAVSATGTFATTQKLQLSEAIQKSAGTNNAAGEANSLLFGVNPAIISGELEGSVEGLSFGAKES